MEQDAPASIKYRSHGAPKWYARVREKSGMVTKLFLIGPQHNEDERRAHIIASFPHVEYLDSWQTDQEPPILAPVPKSFYMHGIIEAVEREVAGGSGAPRISRVPIQRRTIERKV